MWHVACNTWHVICGMWNVARDASHSVHTHSKIHPNITLICIRCDNCCLECAWVHAHKHTWTHNHKHSHNHCEPRTSSLRRSGQHLPMAVASPSVIPPTQLVPSSTDRSWDQRNYLHLCCIGRTLFLVQYEQGTRKRTYASSHASSHAPSSYASAHASSRYWWRQLPSSNTGAMIKYMNNKI